ncbi:MAG TPA: HAD hydrolase family protein [Opitutaceae bacterium]|jgi:3-deoxy-D-manno-octulosonate 8-phosphate phosphatase (KDO 8-P phosphatase)
MKRRRIALSEWGRVRLFAMDVDGVLTDGTITVSSDGTESKRFAIIDGLGLILVGGAGVLTAWISGRESKATLHRAKELRIPTLIQGRRDKLEALTALAGELGVPLSACAYMGDDFIDAPAIAAAGIGISVPTGLPAALAAADYVTSRLPGQGAVREVCDLILGARAVAGRRRR